MEMFERTLLVIDQQQHKQLENAHVIVFGLGGVGGYVCEALARSGIGHLTIVDCDIVDVSNKNRQIIALDSTVGERKTTVMAARLRDINDSIKVTIIDQRVTQDNIEQFFGESIDYAIDAIDQLSAKLALAVYCKQADIKLISSMGTGNKLDPTRVEVADIYDTDTDPMARLMRKELKRVGVDALKVVFSREKPIRNNEKYEETQDFRKPGSLVFVPAVAGLTLASVVVKDLMLP
jgi:tRNA A37 threonylcarbamoyladenosine dehydratase